MTKSLLVAGAVAMLLSACTSSGQPDASGITPQPTSSPEKTTVDRPETRCTGTASRSINGKTRRVRIQVTPCRVLPEEAPGLVLVNIGKTTVGYGPPFKLEKKTRNGWREVNKKQGFNLPLFYLEPGDTSEPQPLAVYLNKPNPIELEPGLYRVTKSVDLIPGKPRPPTMNVSARFRVLRQL